MKINKYPNLRVFPKALLEDLVSGRWMPILGAGMSMNADTPKDTTMPNWKKLADLFANELDWFSATSTLDMISSFEHEMGRARLIEKLGEFLLVGTAKPGKVHSAFCKIPFDIVCTTNFDFLLEDQYNLHGNRRVYPIVDEQQLSVNLHGKYSRTLLLKPHGDLHHPNNLVATEDDYDNFIFRNPIMATFIASLLVSRTAILIGYSLDDPDFRQLLAFISNRLGKGKRTIYVLTVGSKQSDISRYARRGVRVINLGDDLSQYGELLTSTFEQLREYWQENSQNDNEFASEIAISAIKTPIDIGRTCYFSVPKRYQKSFHELLFPILTKMGLFPIFAEDILNPGDQFRAKLEFVVEKCILMYVDYDYEFGKADLDLYSKYFISDGNATNEDNTKLSKLLIVGYSDTFPQDFIHVNTALIKKPSKGMEFIDEENGFIDNIVSLIQKIGLDSDDTLRSEIERLFSAQEYRSAVISSITYLETELNKFANLDAENLEFKSQSSKYVRSYANSSIIQKIRFLHSTNVLSDAIYNKLLNTIKLRNSAAHTAKIISKSEASNCIKAVFDCVQELKSKSDYDVFEGL